MIYFSRYCVRGALHNIFKIRLKFAGKMYWPDIIYCIISWVRTDQIVYIPEFALYTTEILF